MGGSTTPLIQPSQRCYRPLRTTYSCLATTELPPKGVFPIQSSWRCRPPLWTIPSCLAMTGNRPFGGYSEIVVPCSNRPVISEGQPSTRDDGSPAAPPTAPYAYVCPDPLATICCQACDGITIPSLTSLLLSYARLSRTLSLAAPARVQHLASFLLSLCLSVADSERSCLRRPRVSSSSSSECIPLYWRIYTMFITVQVHAFRND